jgi:predicted lipoprotein
MKLIQNLGIALIVCFLAIAINSQLQSPGSATPDGSSILAARSTNLGEQAILVDFADRVVVPTYQQLAAKTEVLVTAVNALAQNPTAATIKAAQDAWVDARIPLKQGDNFALGVARSWGLDGTLDTLPLDKTDLSKILASEIPLTPEYINSQRDSLKGFRTLEFLLFGEKSKGATLSPREVAYAQAAAIVLNNDTHRLLAAWTQSMEGKPAFREVFSSAGEPGNTIYPSVAIAQQEIVDGMVETAEVLGDSIADPFKDKDPKKIEAQYAIASSTQDFHNSLLCLQNAYFGSLNNPVSGTAGLSAFVAQANPQLNAQVKTELKAAIAAVDQIPSPFSLAITDPKVSKNIEAAIAAISQVKDTLETEVKSLIQ